MRLAPTSPPDADPTSPIAAAARSGVALLALVGIAVAAPAPAAGATNPKSRPATVVSVVDGDSVRVRYESTRKVRTLALRAVDAPELAKGKGRARTAAGCGAVTARSRLRTLLPRRRTVRVQLFGSNRAVITRGKRNAGVEQVRLGSARLVRNAKGVRGASTYRKALAAAQRRKRGVWSVKCGSPFVPGLAAGCQTLANPIDPRQQTELPWGRRSNWLQPWRAYLETRSADELRRATGIIFDADEDVTPATARMLGASGFRSARFPVDWGIINRRADDSLVLGLGQRIPTTIRAFRENGLRPMILLNANPRTGSGFPRPLTLKLLAPAANGSRTLQLDPQDPATAQVQAGKSGLSAYGLRPGVLITSVDPAGLAQLSRPLDRALPAGPIGALTLKVAPFQRPARGGAPNPVFQETLAAWLEYVGFATRSVRDLYGSDDFDVEVWNELSFDTEFLDANQYYEPDIDTGTGNTNRAILDATVRYLEDPANGVSGVRVGDGFASNDPLPSAATAPPGLAAINKHPYAPLWAVYPGVDDKVKGLSPLGDPAVDALGRPDAQNDFAPTFRSHFPEHFLTGMETDHLIRDLSPITSTIDGVPHGRRTGPAKVWVSEHTLAPVVPNDAVNRYVQPKIVLRSLLSYVGTGADLVELYSADDQQFGLVDPGFFATVRAGGGAYPGEEAGGRTMAAMRRLSQTLGPGYGSSSSQLSLKSISDCHNHVQFRGDGTAAHPTLFNRDVLAFFPFQTGPSRHVVPYWVMTRDVAKGYRGELGTGDPAHYDFRPESYTLQIGGIRGATPRVSTVDPVTGQQPRATLVDRTGDVITVQVEATDSPRLLVLE